MTDLSRYKTTLNDRILCADGDSIVGLPFLYEYVLDGKSPSDLFVSKKDFKSEEVQYFNKRYPKDKVTYKSAMKDFSFEWNIPSKFKELDITKYVTNRLKEELRDSEFTPDEKKHRILRTKMELRSWNKRKLDDLLRTLIYVVNTFEQNDIVWGTGRGSSCASYILYLIGLHQVDSVMYDLDIGEFFR